MVHTSERHLSGLRIYKTYKRRSGQTMLQEWPSDGSSHNLIGFPPIKQPLALEAEALAFVCPRKNGAEKGDIFMSHLNSITIVGFVGADPEQRQARNNGSKFTVLSVATQRSWKNTEDEWVSKVEWHRVAIFRPRLAEAVLNNIKKGAHVLVEGSLVS